MSSEREEGEKIGAMLARLETHGEQIDKLFVLHRDAMQANLKWQTEVRSDIQFFRHGVDQIKSELKSYEHNRKVESQAILERVDEKINAAPCHVTPDPAPKADKHDRIELLKLWLIAVITLSAMLGGLFKGGADVAAITGKLLP